MSARVGVIVSTETRGGAEQYLLRLYAGLRRYGISGHLLGALPGWPDTGLDSTPTPAGPKWSRRNLAASLVRAPRERSTILGAVRAAHRSEPFDAFHLQFKKEQVLLTRGLADLAPVLWTEHGTLPIGPTGSGLRAAYGRAAAAAARVICVSERVADDVTRASRREADLVVIENAVDETRFRPPTDDERRSARYGIGVDPAEVVIAVVSRLHARKRVHRLLDALPPVDGPTVVVAGDGPERVRLESATRGRPVRFLGWVENVEDVYRAADAVFVPAATTGEGAPTTAMLEAASSGCALVAIDGDEIADAVRAAGGVVLAPPERLDVESLRHTLPERRAAARRWASGHALEPWLTRHADVLRQVIDRR